MSLSVPFNPNAEAPKPFLFRGKQLLVLQPTGDRPVALRFNVRRTYGSLLWYHVYTPDGRELTRGTLNAAKPATLPATEAPQRGVERRRARRRHDRFAVESYSRA